jgi:hypothetical protein
MTLPKHLNCRVSSKEKNPEWLIWQWDDVKVRRSCVLGNLPSTLRFLALQNIRSSLDSADKYDTCQRSNAAAGLFLDIRLLTDAK